jgi:hypothetical protein
MHRGVGEARGVPCGGRWGGRGGPPVLAETRARLRGEAQRVAEPAHRRVPSTDANAREGARMARVNAASAAFGAPASRCLAPSMLTVWG